MIMEDEIRIVYNDVEYDLLNKAYVKKCIYRYCGASYVYAEIVESDQEDPYTLDQIERVARKTAAHNG